ncbi:hypothetical protein V8G54_028209 [Vigna mungo]|uniref:Tonoplast intrinsic protein n=1 Tax=Vigna mungo TaxID=3915 RepID=A0AAQ3RKN5_VIGMU
MTFGLVYTVYTTDVDPKRGSLGTIAPIAIGFIVGANILLGGAFSGAAMNPTVTFGPTVVSWTWENNWIYWVGLLISGGIAGVIYEVVFIIYASSLCLSLSHLVHHGCIIIGVWLNVPFHCCFCRIEMFSSFFSHLLHSSNLLTLNLSIIAIMNKLSREED